MTTSENDSDDELKAMNSEINQIRENKNKAYSHHRKSILILIFILLKDMRFMRFGNFGLDIKIGEFLQLFNQNLDLDTLTDNWQISIIKKSIYLILLKLYLPKVPKTKN